MVVVILVIHVYVGALNASVKAQKNLSQITCSQIRRELLGLSTLS